MPTAAQIDQACRDGYFVFVSNRQRVMGATASFHGVDAAKGHVWVHMWRTGLWDEVALSAITVTNELIQKEHEMSTAVESGTGKKSGKRGGPGHTSLPSESQKRAVVSKDGEKKGDATSSLKDLGEIVGRKDTAPAEGTGKKASKKKATVTVSRTSAKQGELPGVQTSKRKVVEIETLAEELETRKDEKKAAPMIALRMRRKT